MLAAASVLEPSIEMLGVEIQPAHADAARRLLSCSDTKGATWRVEVGDMFRHDLGKLQWQTDGPLLVLGNPPWVTLSDLGAMDSIQIPDRTNLRSVRGIDALTGESNFDVAEYIWMRLLTELRREEPTVALLCKTSVARRVLTLAAHLDLHVADSFLWRIDAKKMFGIGPYTFAPWKVAVSGLHKAPRFQLVGPSDGRPVLFDDTSYFLPCGSAAEAAVLLGALTSEAATLLLKSLMFTDAKRPVTKRLLQRIDLAAIIRHDRAAVEKDAQAALKEAGQHLDAAAIARVADQLLQQWGGTQDAPSLFDVTDLAAHEPAFAEWADDSAFDVLD